MRKEWEKADDELIGAKIFDLLPPDIVARRRPYADEVIRTGQAGRFEDVRGGRSFDNSIHPIFDAEGRVARLAILSRDITERKRVEEELEEGRSKLAAALASMTDAVFISDATGRYIDFNEAFATFHKFKNKDEYTKSFTEATTILDIFLPDGTLAPLGSVGRAPGPAGRDRLEHRIHPQAQGHRTNLGGELQFRPHPRQRGGHHRVGGGGP